MNPIKIEVGQYHEINKGSLKASFSLVIYPQGQKILDCKYFAKDNQRWFGFPQKEIKREGAKSDYIPLVSYLDKDYLEQLKTAILHALKEQETKNVQNQSNSRPANSFQAKSSPDSGDLPF